jgi:hypothetical protein
MSENAAIRYLNSHGKRDGLTDRARLVFDSCINVSQLTMAMSYARRCATKQQPPKVAYNWFLAVSWGWIYEQEMLYAYERARIRLRTT